MRSLVELAQARAERHPDKVAFSFSYNGDADDVSQLTYGELDARARLIATDLQGRGAAGRRALVLCRPGLDHIAGLFGCLYAGAVAIPVHERLAPRLTSVVPDAQADFVVATSQTQSKIKAVLDLLGDGRRLQWCLSDGVNGHEAAGWVPPDPDPGSVAMVQYTSGSTGSPKGVVLTHGNLLHNLEAIRGAWGGGENDVALFWLPQHHDMGLIGGIFNPMFVGCTTVLMSPTAFIKRPMRWLEAISAHRATYTVAPNFAYEKCLEQSTEAERAALDLSCLSTAMNGAEPIRVETMNSFADAFAPAGFRHEAFQAVYGLADATLLVSGGSGSTQPTVAYVSRVGLQQDRVVDGAREDPATVALVGCGAVRGGLRVAIVDPETERERGPDEVGEIWLAGPSVAQGYWARPQETVKTFAAHLSDSGEGPFLRTGDLGFVRSGELFITGRVKDLIVIDGGNYYPNDVEFTVQQCHPLFLSGRGAAFAVARQSGGADELVIVQEADRDLFRDVKIAEVMSAVTATVRQSHGVRLQSLVVVEPMSIPTTTSGKIQRGRCRQTYLDRGFDTVAEAHAAPVARDRETEALAKAAAMLKMAIVAQRQATR
ncbi:fatty acyl-AMP ligase [Mycobacterium paraterrae]|uniref:Fatty acyl-AMP ligase n=1 Tax=Mycobacterium paraterrae TaxID=577492 RepID=A0ABY3VTU4_9MYCO|nr:fatty acyl-AMP ligase [Mycobacterium paraterrae]UMB70622.1 fatty acyl-AMP ligase [Mycobacterium paraterrae]